MFVDLMEVGGVFIVEVGGILIKLQMLFIAVNALFILFTIISL